MSIGTYGLQKVDVSPTITDAAVQYLRDTDLSLVSQTAVSQTLTPQKGAIATLNGAAQANGSGYPLGPGGQPKVVTCVENGGTGSGATFRVTTKAGSGILRCTSSVKNTAQFDSFQNGLALNENIGTSQFRYARVTATGQGPDGTTSAVAGTSATGPSGTFIITITGGQLTGANVSAVGTGYLVGDILTITKAAVEGGLAGITVQGDLKLLLTEDNVLGALDTVEVVNAGQGYVAADTLTVTINESTFIGTGTVEVATLSGAQFTPGDIKVFPMAFANTGTTVESIRYMDLAGNTQVLGNCQPGRIYPIQFQQILGASTGATGS